MKKFSKILLRTLVYGSLFLLALIIFSFAAIQTEPARQFMIDEIQKQAALAGHNIELEKLEGHLPFTLKIASLKITDTKGEWLILKDLSFSWNPWSLVGGELFIDHITTKHLSVVRQPEIPPSSSVSKESGPVSIPTSLPIKLFLQQFDIEKISLGKTLLGEPVELSLNSSVQLRDLDKGLLLKLALNRTDGVPGFVDAHLHFSPSSNNLKLTLDAREPKGGLVGGLIGLPQEENIIAKISGNGPLKHWKGSLNFEAGNNLWLRGQLAVQPAKDNSLMLQSQIKGNFKTFLPTNLYPLQGEAILFENSFTRNNSGTINIDDFQINGNFGKFSLRGQFDPADPLLNLTYGFNLAPGRELFALAGNVKWEALTVSGNLKGNALSPKVSANLKIVRPALEELSVDTFSASLNLNPRPSKSQIPELIDLVAQASIQGAKGIPPEILNLLGHKPNMSLSLTANTKSQEVTLHKAQMKAASFNLLANGKARNWGKQLTLNSTLNVPDLNHFSEMAKNPLTGSFVVKTSSELLDYASRIDTTLNGGTNQFSTGIDVVDSVFNQDISFSGKVNRDSTGTINFPDFSLTAQPINLILQGTLDSNQSLNANWNLDIPNLSSFAKAIQQNISGGLHSTGQVSGSIENPQVNAQVESREINLDKNRLENLNVRVTGQDLLKHPNGGMELSAKANGIHAEMLSHYKLADNKFLHIYGLKASLPGVLVTGDLAQAPPSALWGGSIKGMVTDMNALGRLVNQDISGTLNFKTELLRTKGQGLIFEVTGSNLSIQNPQLVSINDLRLNGQVKNLLENLNLIAKVKVSDIQSGVGSIDSFNMSLDGFLEQLNWAIQTNGKLKETIKADLNGTLEKQKTSINLKVSNLNAEFAHIPLKSTRPLKISVMDNSIQVSDLDWDLKGGHIHGNASLQNQEISLNTKITQLPLALADLFAPELQIRGFMDGDIDFNGGPANPNADLNLSFKKVQALDLKTPKPYYGTGSVTIHLDPGSANAQASFKQTQFGHLDLNGSLPVTPAAEWAKLVNDNSPIQGRIDGAIDLASLNPFLASTGDKVQGKLKINGAMKGNLKAPDIAGEVLLKDGIVDVLMTGTHLEKIHLNISATPDLVLLKEFSAETLRNGSMIAKGSVQKTPDNDFLTDVSFKMKQAQLAAIDDLQLYASSDILFKGPLSKSKLSGTLQIDKAEIRIPSKLPPNVVVVDVERKSNATQIQKEKSEKTSSSKIKMETELDLKIVAPNQIYIKGRGLNAELEGKVAVTGTVKDPRANGSFTMRRGLWNILGKKLKFKRGVVQLQDAPKNDPEIDFETEIKSSQGKIIFALQGSAFKPTINYWSEPELPKDEVLSRFLFNKDVGEISAVEAVKLASSAAELAGLMSGPSITERISNRLGLDSVDVSGDGDGGANVEAGKYVSDKVYVGVIQGTKPGSTGAKVDVELTPNITVQGQMKNNSDSNFGITWGFDYD